MGGLLHMVQLGGAWAWPQPAQALLAVPNVTVHPSTANVPITVLLYNGSLLCGFNVPIRVNILIYLMWLRDYNIPVKRRPYMSFSIVLSLLL